MDPILWLLVVLIGGIIGLIVYLVVRGERPILCTAADVVGDNLKASRAFR